MFEAANFPALINADIVDKASFTWTCVPDPLNNQISGLLSFEV
jgi:hypothetical protein